MSSSSESDIELPALKESSRLPSPGFILLPPSRSSQSYVKPESAEESSHDETDSDSTDSEDEIPTFKLGSQATAKESSLSRKKKQMEIQSLSLESFLKAQIRKSNEEFLKRHSLLHQPGIEKLDAVPPLKVGRRKLRRERLKEREKSKGPAWFNMPATELTEEKKNDFMALQMRKALDPKHFYKRSALKNIPKYFQVGRVVESPADFYSDRVPKKQRKQTLVDELLADVEFRKYQKRKYAEALSSQPQKMYHTKKKKINKIAKARQNK